MNKNEFISNLNIEISNGKALLDRFERLQEYNDDFGDGMAYFGSGYRHKYNPNEKNKLANDFTLWERRVLEILLEGKSWNSVLVIFKKLLHCVLICLNLFVIMIFCN